MMVSPFLQLNSKSTPALHGTTNMMVSPNDTGAKTKICRPLTAASTAASTSSYLSSASPISSNTELIRTNIIGNRCLIPSPFGQRKEVVYADYTASGRALQFVEDFMTKVVAPTYANTHTEASATGSQTTYFRNEAREIIQKAVNAPSNDYVVLFTGSGSTGAIDKLFRVLGLGISEFAEKKWNLSKAIPDSERPVVFISHFEHHSNELIWRESIARCIVIREGKDGSPDLEHLETELLKYQKYDKKGPSLIGSFSAGSNVTGIRAPVRSICKLLHKYGAYAFFDYAGVGAYVEVDVQGNSEGIDDGSLDAAFFSPHKMVGGPGSSGILVARDKLFQKAFDVKTNQASTPAGGTIEFVTRNTHTYSKDIEYREDAGTPGILQDIRSGLALKVKEMIGCHTIEKLDHIHCSLALNAWTPNPYIALMGADRMSYHFATRRVSIFSFNILSPVPSALPNKSGGNYLQERVFDSLNHLANVGSSLDKENPLHMIPLHFNFVIALLNDLYGIQGRGGCSCAGPYGVDLFQVDDHKVDFDTLSQFPASKPGWARVNLNYFLSNHEVKFITEAVKQIAKYGWMLLPLYVQDAHSGRYFHHTMIDRNGNEKKTHTKSSSSTFSRSLHDLLRFEDSEESKSNQKMTASIPEVKYETIDRPRSSYIKVLREAMKLYKSEADRTTKRTHVRDFTSSSLAKVSSMNKEKVDKSIWWLLPTQAEEFLVGAGENTNSLAQ